MQLFEIQNPDIRDRLRYNILPSDMEKAAIDLSIHFAESGLVEIEAQDSTQDSVATLRRYTEEYSSLLAPIRRLSVEILQLILAEPNIHDTKWIGPNRVTIYRPDLIGAVSYRWREVALATPILWSSFQVSLRRSRCSDLQWIRTRLELSKNTPLTISFSAAHMFPEDGSTELELHTQAVREIAAEFLLEAERWAHLALPFESDFMDLLSPAQGRLHWLEVLGFGKAVSMGQKTIKIFQNAPKLRSLSLSEAASIEHLPDDAFPWKQLTQLSTPFDSKPSVETILERSPQLQALILYADDAADLDTPNLGFPRRNSKLRTVVLNGEQSEQISCLDILASMDTPVLKEIYLSRCWAWNPLRIPALLKRSKCSLETLVLVQSRVRPAELLALFSAMPTLRTLALVNNAPNTVTNIVVQALTPRSQAVPMLASLHTFVLRGTYLCSTDKLLALLESRIRHQHPLMNIDIALDDRLLRTPDLQRLAAFAGRGVVTAYSPSVLSVYAGAPGRNVGYSHPQTLDGPILEKVAAQKKQLLYK
ncbi:hypothetical protein C8R45DRAFT_1075783 [Mycena sanguinolenta]|nr:hypothetical protein C8R45DRAFT_1075783 [Mycena sanguinolenta]